MATHRKVHELIAAGAPLEEVLVEMIEGAERQDPSALGCVVLLDRESSTLHPGAGPSLPAEWLQAIDGVVIGPNIGSCGSAAWSGRLTISSDIAEDPKWAPVRDFALANGFRYCWSMPNHLFRRRSWELSAHVLSCAPLAVRSACRSTFRAASSARIRS